MKKTVAFFCFFALTLFINASDNTLKTYDDIMSFLAKKGYVSNQDNTIEYVSTILKTDFTGYINFRCQEDRITYYSLPICYGLEAERIKSLKSELKTDKFWYVKIDYNYRARTVSTRDSTYFIVDLQGNVVDMNVGEGDINLDYTITDDNKNYLLIYFSNYGFLNEVRKLVSAGADVNYYSKFSKQTPLSAAANAGFKDIVSFLIKNGAAVSDKNDPILFRAMTNCDSEMVEILKKAGARVQDANFPENMCSVEYAQEMRKELSQEVQDSCQHNKLDDKKDALSKYYLFIIIGVFVLGVLTTILILYLFRRKP